MKDECKTNQKASALKLVDKAIAKTQSQINEIELKLAHDEPVQLINDMEMVSDVSRDAVNDQESQAAPMFMPPRLNASFSRKKV